MTKEFLLLSDLFITQDTALAVLKTGSNVFLTGAPGAGKTYVLNQYIQYLRSHKIPVAVTASTGIAATHVGGVTIQSWAGLGIATDFDQTAAKHIASKQKVRKHVENTKVLVIDEVSMMDGRVLDGLNLVMQAAKNSKLPFGGLQVVLVGDFFQLPPIADRGTTPQFAFTSAAWRTARFQASYITEQHRQDDEKYLAILEKIRRGEVDDAGDFEPLEQRMNADFDETQTVTKLYTHNKNVDHINQVELQALDTKSETFLMETTGAKAAAERLEKSCLSPHELVLKIGSRVMCTKNNWEAGYANGTLGEVIDFDSDTGNPIIMTNSSEEIIVEPVTWRAVDGEKTLATIEQVPLRLAWAITVHKSQGMSLDAAEIDLSQAFEYGQGYVALSRVRTLAGLRLVGFSPTALMVHPDVRTADENFQKQSDYLSGYVKEKGETQMQLIWTSFIEKTGGSVEAVKVSAPAGPDKKTEKTSTYEKTRLLVLTGLDVEEIAVARELSARTITEHLYQLIKKENLDQEEIKHLKPDNQDFHDSLQAMQEIYITTEDDSLRPFKDKLPDVSYEDLQLYRLWLELN